ncbi:hypothetical protein DEO72_LG8g1193 [Vigna unguiculata]|uniref:Uncharacterized protein n=1 Tax=Vigna unguiculata TaxID=3917 RepID=A0A4D6MRB2_VIGUN|nr:hypothetical protein DEO72_LG8g1193 [Vigna unguiculata]
MFKCARRGEVDFTQPLVPRLVCSTPFTSHRHRLMSAMMHCSSCRVILTSKPHSAHASAKVTISCTQPSRPLASPAPSHVVFALSQMVETSTGTKKWMRSSSSSEDNDHGYD